MIKRIFTFWAACTLILGLCACEQSINEQTGSSEQKNWQEQYDLGLRYLEEGNYEEAIIAFTAAIEIDSKQALAYIGRGDAYVQSGETEENLAAAQADYEKAIDLNETLVEAYLGLANVYILYEDYERALEILRQGLESVEDNQKIANRIAEIEQEDSTERTDTYGNCWGSAFLTGDKIQQFWPDGTSSYTMEAISYNDYGLPTVVETTEGSQLTIYYEWNEDGQITQKHQQYPDNNSVKIFLSYDEQGRIISMNTGDSSTSGNNWDARGFEYDKYGRVVKCEECFEDPERTCTIMIAYDEKGRTSCADTYRSGELVAYTMYYHNE